MEFTNLFVGSQNINGICVCWFRWYLGQYTLASVFDTTYRILFEVQHGIAARADVALDDITLIDGPCEGIRQSAISGNLVHLILSNNLKDTRY